MRGPASRERAQEPVGHSRGNVVHQAPYSLKYDEVRKLRRLTSSQVISVLLRDMERSLLREFILLPGGKGTSRFELGWTSHVSPFRNRHDHGETDLRFSTSSCSRWPTMSATMSQLGIRFAARFRLLVSVVSWRVVNSHAYPTWQALTPWTHALHLICLFLIKDAHTLGLDAELAQLLRPPEPIADLSQARRVDLDVRPTKDQRIRVWERFL